MNWSSTKYPINISEIKKIENYYHIILPEDYVAQIGAINGATLDDAFILHPELDELLYSRNVNLSQSATHSIYDIFGKIKNGYRFFPFADDDFGNYFCFDLIKNNVVFWNHETDRTFYICDTFSELLNMIVSAK